MIPRHSADWSAASGESSRDTTPGMPRSWASAHTAAFNPLRDPRPVLLRREEAVFALCSHGVPRQALCDNLIYASSVAGGQTVVVLTLRADFYGKCASLRALSASLSEHQMLVGPMTNDELQRNRAAGPARWLRGTVS